MNQQDFCYWLNGFIELNEGKMPTPAQWKSICEHLGLVFNKVTPKVAKGTELTELPGAPKPNLAEIIEDVKRKIQQGEQREHWILPTRDFGPLIGPNDYPPGLTITC